MLAGLTKEEKALIIQSLIGSYLRQPLWKGLVESIFTKLGLEEAAKDTFEHYHQRALQAMKAEQTHGE